MQRRPPLLIANWKMAMTLESARTWCQEAHHLEKSDAQVMICPTFAHIPFVSARLLELGFEIGAQDVSIQEKGAFTGEVSAGQLREIGCTFILVGHSERRRYHFETDEVVLKKTQQCLAYALTPIVCIGETLEEREAGITTQVLTTQIKQGIPQGLDTSLVIAYEPVWAIGTGRTAAQPDIISAHACIHETLASHTKCQDARVVYGGSVTSNNASDILTLQGVDGLLVGGASLDAKSFLGMARATQPRHTAERAALTEQTTYA